MSFQKLGIGTRTPSKTFDVSGNAVVSETLSVSDATTLSSTLHVADSVTLSSTLSVGGITTFEKIPTAPTANNGTNDSSIATTEFVNSYTNSYNKTETDASFNLKSDKTLTDASFNTKQDNLSFGISDTNAVKIDGTAADDSYARFTSSGIEGRTIVQVKSDLGISNITNESTEDVLTSSQLTGTPTAPTPLASDNSTQIATTAFVHTAVSDLVS